jgi:hypothetical protein
MVAFDPLEVGSACNHFLPFRLSESKSPSGTTRGSKTHTEKAPNPREFLIRVSNFRILFYV